MPYLETVLEFFESEVQQRRYDFFSELMHFRHIVAHYNRPFVDEKGKFETIAHYLMILKKLTRNTPPLFRRGVKAEAIFPKEQLG